MLLLSCTCGTHHQRLVSQHLCSNSKKLLQFLTHRRYLLDICLAVILRLRVYCIFFQVDSSFSGKAHTSHTGEKRSAAWRTVLTHRGWTEPAASTLTMLKHATLHTRWCTFTHIVSEDYLSERLSKIEMKECRTDFGETEAGRGEQSEAMKRWCAESTEGCRECVRVCEEEEREEREECTRCTAGLLASHDWAAASAWRSSRSHDNRACQMEGREVEGCRQGQQRWRQR